MADELLEALRSLTGSTSAEFRRDQREAIEALVTGRDRVLLVQRTGWGKSAVYFLATHLLRQRGLGPTLLISPLLALVRNQMDAASRLGLRTITLNSSSDTTIRELTAALSADEIDLVLVSPERLANPEFADQVMPLVGRRPGLMVIDEAHCISDWGHDFRPDYRRLSQVISGLGQGIPVLACTATANDRVVADVADQLGAAGHVIRGPLGRRGLGLHVVELPAAAERLAWLHQVLPTLEGTGIIYCLTVRDVERVSSWLQAHGHDVLPYTGASDGEARLEAEARLQRNEVKALVATSALGMGYDKADLAFVVHYQAPGSPVAYYQQVGRAGRQLERSVGVLLRGAEDADIQDWFITTAFPDPSAVDDVLAVFDTAPGPVTLGRVLEAVNMKRGDAELVLKQLTVEGVLRRLSVQTYERTLKQWVYPTQRVEAVTAGRRLEQDQMRIYAVGGMCRMEFLTRVLDDPDPQPCGECDLCTGARFRIVLDEQLVAEAERFLRRGYVVIEPRKRKLGQTLRDGLRLQHGRALCIWNDPGWGKLVADGKRTGHFDDRLINALVAMITEWTPEPAPTWVTFVPSLRRPALVPDLARRVRAARHSSRRAAVPRRRHGRLQVDPGRDRRTPSRARLRPRVPPCSRFAARARLVSVNDASLAALLLTNRIVDVGERPLSAGEFWSLCEAIDDLSLLVGMSASDIAEMASLSMPDADRYAALLGAGTAFAFERERLEEEGVRLISALDDAFPERLRSRLRDACPSFLLVGGPAEHLDLNAIGVVGSRDASAEALDVAASTSKVAAAEGRAVVSGLARGIDQTAMAAALDAGVPVIGVPAEGIRVAARSPEIRRRAHAGELCIASPYGPTMRFTAGNAMGRNKIIYALADVTLVVCSDAGSGGTWEGAKEAMRRSFGRVAVWTGDGAGPGNPKLVALGGVPVVDVDELVSVEPVESLQGTAKQPSLFD